MIDTQTLKSIFDSTDSICKIISESTIKGATRSIKDNVTGQFLQTGMPASFKVGIDTNNTKKLNDDDKSEPMGKYMISLQGDQEAPEGFESGKFHAKSPLVLNYTRKDGKSWLDSIRSSFNNLKGKQLSQEILKSGYDSIVTFEVSNGKAYSTLIVDLTNQQINENSQIDTDNFKRWFKNSKVVDNKGRPLVVYHGTAQEFDQFDPERAIGSQFWFTDSKEKLDSGEIFTQGKGVIMPVFLSIQNPVGWKEYDKLGIGEIRGRGHDGIILPDGDETTFIVFDPRQVKSAVKNNGKFNPRFKSIFRESVGSDTFNTKDTDMPTYNDMLRSPEYFETQKNRKFKIVKMSPDEYLKACSKGFSQPVDQLIRSRDPKVIRQYAGNMKSGNTFPMVVLDYSRGDFTQEGIHRALAAKLSGIEEIPVMVVNDAK